MDPYELRPRYGERYTTLREWMGGRGLSSLDEVLPTYLK